MRVGILGAAEVRLEGEAIDLGTRKQRALLAALALHRGRTVPVDTLVDLLWGESPPPTVNATLQGYVAGLRRALEPDRPARAPSSVLVTREGGYALDLPPGSLDVEAFESVVGRVHAALGTVTVPQGSLAGAEEMLADLETALASWRGTPYAELEDAPAAGADRARLEELRALALEDRAVAALALGRHATVAAELEVLTSTYPLRERLWALRALALARAGRQADALEVLREVRDLLADELGLEPGAQLRELQTAVLRQDPDLAWVPTTQAPAAPQPGATPPSSPTPPWALVGRDDELAALVGALEQSAEAPVFAALTGDPGIGKSRLCLELAEVARAQGVTVVGARCSQDEGAPPLRPWGRVLEGLGEDLPSAPADGGAADGASRFRAWESIVTSVLAAARERHVLVVLDDLHWADTSTLRVLRLLAESAEQGRLLVVATWRPQPPPTGQLASVAEMLARRHALRLELSGLDPVATAEVVTRIAGAAPTASEVEALRERTDGNPFFLVEYARLVGEGGLSELLSEDHPPAAVHDVVSRRIAALPEETAHALRHACVVGRDFDLATLAAATGTEVDALLDALEPALAAGLVVEVGVDRMRFAHALVRDTAYAVLPQSRRARLHARIATFLQDEAGRESEVARHWLAAGPSYADRAWRAARTAADAAHDVYAWDEAAGLLEGGLTALDQDPAATADDRFGLLLDLARALRRIDDLVRLRATVHRALEIAGDDPARGLGAIDLLVANSLWQWGSYTGVDRVVVETLRRCLEALPEGDSAERCRAMIALATESYAAATVQEREALCEQALAMARRLGDDALLLHCLLAVPLALWSPPTAEQRHALTHEAVEVAERLGDETRRGTALAMRATAAAETGRVAGLLDLIAEARSVAVRQRQQFAQMYLDGLEIPWRAMRGEREEMLRLLDSMVAGAQRVEVPQANDALLGAFLMDLLWGGRLDELAAMADQVAGVEVMPTRATTALVVGRVGDLERAQALLDELEDAELGVDWWFSLLSVSAVAEAAARTGRKDLAATAYRLLAPFAGRPAAAGSGTIVGVVDHYLAFAAHVTGERDLALRHADDAVRLCREWEIPLAASWFEEARAEIGF